MDEQTTIRYTVTNEIVLKRALTVNECSVVEMKSIYNLM